MGAVRRIQRRGFVVGQLLLAATAAAALLFSLQQLAGPCSARGGRGRKSGPEGEYLAMCLIVKDQNKDIVEWVEHHRALGAGKFYVWEHNSTSPAVQELFPHLAAGLVSYHYFREFEHASQWAQSFVYDKCLELYGHKHRFMAFIDTDEFIIPRGEDRHRPLPDLLREYEDYGALVINERLMGSSGHLARPAGGVLANYWACLPMDNPESLHVKTIANTRFTAAAGADPHHFTYTAGRYAVNEHYKRVDGARSASASQDRVSIYHYATGSATDFAEKMRRGAAHGLVVKSLPFFEKVEAAATDVCEDALPLAEVWQSGYRQLAGPGVDFEALLKGRPFAAATLEDVPTQDSFMAAQSAALSSADGDEPDNADNRE